MQYLLDTNIFLWSLNGDKKLKEDIKEIIKDFENQIFISIASAWEISIKNRVGKLPLKTTLSKCFEIAGFKILDINLIHVLEFNRLSLHKNHRDPFDRMLISQARAENLTFITTDKKIWKYNLSLLKA
ncbi:MAG: type II toxin-antitoxin system VapC family toxin [Candidatus Levybacteria bacterium]|nr:type II toxin-antitoxin system VapC family toxin [Candidatus Levybacteria bacterium]